jgi:hypothetical protein
MTFSVAGAVSESLRSGQKTHSSLGSQKAHLNFEIKDRRQSKSDLSDVDIVNADLGNGARSDSRAAAHMLRIPQGPAFVRAQIGCAVHPAAIVALWAILWNGDEAHAHRVANLRMLDRRHSIVGNLIAAIFKVHRAARTRYRLVRTAIDETRFD